MFSPNELTRYARHLSLLEFGMEGQKKLKQGSVCVIGAGGLGAPVLMYLAAAGVGHIGIIEYDIVERTNLQRQILFTDQDVGLKKGEVAQGRLRNMNPDIEVTWHELMLTSDNALEVLQPYDLIIDASDNFPTRYLVNDSCVLLGKPLVYGAIYRFEGQVSVFNLTRSTSEKGPN